jgi:hypothetical protein
MRKIDKILGLGFLLTLTLLSCRKSMDAIVSNPVQNPLAITSSVGVALQTTFVTTDVKMNVKTDAAQTVTVKILDIANRVVSKSTSDVVSGDNILTVYAAALPTAAYRLAVYDSRGKLLAITDFNKI